MKYKLEFSDFITLTVSGIFGYLFINFDHSILGWCSEHILISIVIALITISYIVPEFLDIVFNSWKINEILKHSDNFDSKPLEQEFFKTKKAQNASLGQYKDEIQSNKTDILNIFKTH